MKLSEIDLEHGLYVYKNDDGSHGTIGFEYSRSQVKTVLKWLGKGQKTSKMGTKAAFEQYVSVIRAGRAHNSATGERCEADLDPRFTRYFESGERVEVEWKEECGDWTGYGARTDGKKARFYVGMSTGWMPVYLSILRIDSHGGGAISSNSVKSIRGLGIFKRR